MLTTPTYHPGSQPQQSTNSNSPRVLIVSLSTDAWVGGQEIHSFLHYTLLQNNGVHATMLVNPTSHLCQLLQQHGQNFYTIPPLAAWLKRIRFIYHWFVRRCIRHICSKENIDVIHCNNRHEVKDALWVKQKISPLVFFTRHIPEPFRVRELRGVDGVIGVSQHIVDYLKQENAVHKLNIPSIAYVPPFFNAEKFTSFVPTQTRQEFFEQQFGITIDKQTPLLCTIANFYANTLHHKNHPLLLQALHIVIVQHHKPVHALLAGNIDAAGRAFFSHMAQELGITPYIHFLGFTEQTPAILHYSDMMVLPSRHEGFGICYMEAGLSKRPAIGARGTGAEMTIKHEETGLLFKNNDAEDLAAAIERLLDDPTFAQHLGQNAYEHIMKNFSPQVGITRYLELYRI